MANFRFFSFFSFFIIAMVSRGNAQVNAVTFGKNRVQYKKFCWQYYQTDHFNVYFYENGQELAKFVYQLAEKDLTSIEEEAEYSLQRRANIIIYNNYIDFRQSNIGLNTDVLNAGSTTHLVNNKMLVYFDGDHSNLKRQIRTGIAEIITKNLLFGDNLGEIAGNKTLLDLPKWLTDGYVEYLGEHWNTKLDDELKSEMLSGRYKKFSSFCHRNPKLAGHAFWYFIEEKYKKENVTYFLYLARSLKSLNKASESITKLAFKDLTKEFMLYQEEKFESDIRRRRAYPKGNYIEGFDISPRLNYIRFNVNPNKKNNSYLVTRFKNSQVKIILNDDFDNVTVLKYGFRSYEQELHPNYPIIAWDAKGSRVSIVYAEKGRTYLMIYDPASREKKWEIELSDKLDEVQDINYMLNNRTVLLSAVKNGHTDIYSFDLEKEKLIQVTNDVYDDLDASFVSFPNKTGILFASNRPNADVKNADTALPSNHRYNIFMITNFGDKPELNQITQLTDVKYGNARYPAQYNVNHFTFVSDQNGIGNRYAGFFSTKNLGLDTLVLIGEELLRNPSTADIDSILKLQQKEKIDSIAYVSMTADSTFTFALTNYETSLSETRSSGENRILSEVTRQGDQKNLYKLKIDAAALTRRNVTAQPTRYAQQWMRESKKTGTKESNNKDLRKAAADFQTEFENESRNDKPPTETETVYPAMSNDVASSSVRLFGYKPSRYSADFGSAAFNTTVLYNKYQAYGGGSGPIMLSSNTPLNGLITLGASDLMEDKRIQGGFKIGTNLKDNEWFINYQNLRRKIDWGGTYYRNVLGSGANLVDNQGNIIASYPAKLLTNLYQGNITYPFDETKSIRLTTGIRSDVLAVSNVDRISSRLENKSTIYALTHLEYVYDNSLIRMNNIMNGLRYKAYIDWNRQVKGKIETVGPTLLNFGFDARYYYPIYKDFIWAGRFAGDFSWGNQKFIYYLGGVDGWLMFGNNTKPGSTKERYFNTSNAPAADASYAFQSLALNLRGHIQNAANGNNAVVINSEFRLPVLSTLFDRTVNNAFLNNLQITQFIDLGSAWNGGADKISRPATSYNNPIQLPNGDVIPGPVTIKLKTGGVGPFVGGYGFGARSMLLGYFVRYDVGWPMNGFFQGKPIMYVSLGFDF